MKTPVPVGQYFVIFVLLGLGFFTLSPFLGPVVLGLLYALVIYPVQEFGVRKLRLPPAASALLISIAVAVGFLLPAALIGIAVFQEASSLVSGIDVSVFLRSYERVLNYLPVPRETLEEHLKPVLGQIGEAATPMLAKIVASIPSLVVGAAFFILSVYYGLVDGKRLGAFVLDCLPFGSNESAAIASTTEQVCRGVVIGSLAVSLTQGLIIGLTYWFLGIPGALLFACVTALLSFVPALGSGPTGVGGAIFLWSRGDAVGAGVMLAAFGLASVSDNLIRPVILKQGGGLHPLLTLLSALGGLATLGFMGLFLGPLFVALAVVVLTAIRDTSARTVQQESRSY